MLVALPSVSTTLTVLLLLAILGATLAPVGIIVADGLLIDAARGALGHPHGPDASRAIVLGVLIAAGFLLQQVLMPVAQQTGDALGRRLTSRLRERVMAACLTPASVAPLEDREVLDLLAGAEGVGTGQFTPRDALIACANIGASRLQAVACAALIVTFRWWLMLLLLAGFLLLSQGAVMDYRRGQRALTGNPTQLRRASYVRDVTLRPEASKEIRIFGLRDWLDQRFHREWTSALSTFRQQRGSPAGILVVLGCGVLVLQLTGYLTLGVAAAHGELSAGRFVIYAGAMLGLSAVMGVSPDNVKIAQGSASVPLVIELERKLGAAQARNDHGQPAAVDPSVPAFTKSEPPLIRFDKVCFGYRGQEAPLFDNFSLEIPAGRSIAIVGVNGAGKTTLVKLLAGLLQPQAGAIVVDGEALTAQNVTAWQREIGAVFQDFVRYELSAADNVGFGRVERADDQAGVTASSDLADASRIIAGLDEGWDTVLSARFPGGTNLSGGEWQRIALARALFAVRHGARVLILDEPAAALDVRAEAELHDRFLSLTAGVTSVIISHRFSTTRRANLIVVLEHGQVIEKGSHEELLALGGQYSVMFRMQAEHFVTVSAEGADD